MTVASAASAGPASSLAPFFAPRSVAVIGASRNPSRVGGSTVQGLVAVPSLGATEGPVDLAVIAVPDEPAQPHVRARDAGAGWGRVRVRSCSSAGSATRSSGLLSDLPDVVEIELNPLVVAPDGAIAVDARAVLAS